MKPAHKKLLYAGFILLTIAVILLIGIQSGDFPASIAAILSIPKRYVLLSVLSTFGAILMQALSAKSALRAMGRRMPAGNAFAISLLGEFYSYVTPGASGGQPMQIYQMRKQGVPVGDATSALVMHYICFHSTLLITVIAMGVAYADFVREHVGVNLVFLIVGFIFNAMLVVAALMLSFYQRPVRWLLEKIIAVMRRLRIGNPDQLRAKFAETADGFYRGMRFMLRHKAEVARQYLFGIGRLVCLMSVMYFVYRGLGLNEASYGKIFAMSVMQYASAAYTPLPGASGAQEGIFSVYFDRLFPDELLFSGLLAWRFITYYLVLIVGFAVTTALGMRKAPATVPEEPSADAG